jgi:hypothetical protein
MFGTRREVFSGLYRLSIIALIWLRRSDLEHECVRSHYVRPNSGKYISSFPLQSVVELSSLLARKLQKLPVVVARTKSPPPNFWIKVEFRF